MNKTKLPTVVPIDEEEAELIDFIETSDILSWRQHPEFENRKKKFEKAATLSLRKDKKITLRLNESDLNTVKQKAAKLGIGYQTLIGSLIHQYAAGIISPKMR